MERVNERLLNWASILEPDTLAQAERTASMPFVYPHVALMPDAHLGKGATVGSVIPTLGAIIPAAVGVDIGCVDGETEYLSPHGWRKISEYTGGEVMEYDPATGNGRFVEPTAYVVKSCESFYHLRTKYGIDQMLSPDHRILMWKIVGRDRRRVQTMVTAEQFANDHDRLVQGVKGEFATTFAPQLQTKLSLSEAQLRVQVMLHADGTLLRPRRAGLHLVKTRKIERARQLLRDAAIKFTESSSADGSTSIKFEPPMMTKSYSEFWEASAEQLAIISEECLHWDGNEASRCFYTRDKESADFIQYAFTATGYRAVVRMDKHYRDGATDYRVFANRNTMIGMAGVPKTPITREASTDGLAYCFTVPSGFWVMRRGGNVVMTGNCGMAAVRTGWSVDELEGLDRAILRNSIERAIPLSAGRYNVALTASAEKRVGVLADDAAKARFDPASYVGNWTLQLGSLGSGNHFIEVTADEKDKVWLFLHSGSRGIGNKIAQAHIKIARELCERWWISLPDPDLAYLVEGTDEFWRYIRELRWAQRFALLNREEMMDRVVDVFEDWVDGGVNELERINCHHNFTQQERHFGRDVWVSRKGAIEADEGRPGLIPGSMGTASYVVVGRGNRLSLNSSPHGAGRNFSRSAARKRFTHEQLRESMAGIEWRDSPAFLDEIPDAYKDVDQVMADAADLVEVRHTLRQLVNVKGE